MAWMARSIALVVALLLGGCVVPPPAGPTVAALAPKDKDPAQFQQDDASCRQLALGLLGGDQYSAVAQQQQYDLSYAQCMTAHGNIAPVVAPGAAPYGYPYYAAYGYPYAYPYPYYYPYAYPYAYPYGYPWYWGAPVGVGASFFFGSGHGHGHHGHSHGHGSGPHH